jgi:hypothetical protein
MTQPKWTSIVLAAVLASGAWSLFPSTASAARNQTTRSAAPHTNEMLVANRLGFSLGVRPSRYRRGGFSRGGCLPEHHATALVPPTRPQERANIWEVAVDSTVSAHPAFFVHVPQSSPETPALFILQNEQGQELYSTEFMLNGEAGIVGVQVPDSVPELEVGEAYYWQMVIKCDPDEPSAENVVGSWITRVNNRRTPVAARARAAAYANAGIWQDAVSILAKLRYADPSNAALAEDWAALTETAGLSDFVTAPIVQMIEDNQPSSNPVSDGDS